MSILSGLTLRDRRALGVGLVVAALSIAYRLSLPATTALARMREANQRASDHLALAREELLASGTSDSTLAARLVHLVAADSSLLPSGSAGHVASELGSVVRSSARAAGLEVLGATTQSDSLSPGGFQQAEVRLDAQGDVSGLMQFLLLVELAPGLLDVRDLAITPADPAGVGEQAEVLRISITLTGVARASRTSATERLP